METGGSAFPTKVIDHKEADGHGGVRAVYEHIPGMTLRDYFAGQTLAGIHANRNSVVYGMAARESYMQADAMIQEKTNEK